MRSINTLTFIFGIVLSGHSFSFVPSGDTDYFIQEEKQYRLIFTKQHLSTIEKVNQTVKAYINSMSQFKNRTLEEPINIILFSPHTQISNAFATIFPDFTIGLYPSTMVGQSLHLPSWFETIFEHELNHIFQLSHSKTPKAIRKIFNLPSLFFFYLLTPYPNILLPHFVLEGDAVLKESLLTNKGGRLYNGDTRALVYSQIKHYQHQIPKFTKEHLLHFQTTAHSGREKYLHGGYLMAMLAEKYPHAVVNSFFALEKNKPSRKTIKQIKSATIKTKLSKVFADAFSFQYLYYFLDDLVQAYFNHYLKQANEQKNSSEPALFNSFTCPPFNRSGDELFFLTSHYRSLPVLKIFNTKTKKWIDKKTDLPVGKVFKIGDKYYSRSSKTVRPNIRRYSLFSEGVKNLKEFESQYVEELTNKKKLYIDAKNTYEGFKLYLNGKFYADIHSNALWDQKENVYYFKQKGLQRTLYKNKTALFSYKGYYGNIMDIDPNGAVYWTANSLFGSSLYQYKNKTISRISGSDTIIQARKINNREFFVCEVTPFGYEYKIIPIEKTAEQPVLYKYRFKSRSIQVAKYKAGPAFGIQTSKANSETGKVSKISKANQTRQNSQANSTASKANNQNSQANNKTNIENKRNENKQNNKANKQNSQANNKTNIENKHNESKQSKEILYKKYSPFKNIHYSGSSLQGVWGGVLSLINGGILFSDYLMQQQILLSYMGTIAHPVLFDSLYDDSYFRMEDQLLSAKYYNTEHRLNWNLGYAFRFRPGFKTPMNIGEDNNNKKYLISENKYDQGGSLGFSYPLFKEGRWFARTSSQKYLDWIASSRIEASWTGNFTLGYYQTFPYLYAPRRAVISNLFLDYEAHESPIAQDTKAEEISDSSTRFKGGFKAGLRLSSTWHLGSDFYLFPESSYVMSFHPNINPARASLYSASVGLRDPYSPSAYLKSCLGSQGFGLNGQGNCFSSTAKDSAPYLSEEALPLDSAPYPYDDIGSDSFVFSDIFGPLFRRTYQAHSIGTASLGLKKVFILPVNWISLHDFTPLFRVRWIIFENLFSKDGLFFLSKYKKDILPDKDSIYRDIIQKNIDNTKKLFKEQEIEQEEYTQWLEWTFGFETSFLMYKKIRLIMGFSLGFRTPVRFWEAEEDNKEIENQQNIIYKEGGSLDEMMSVDTTRKNKLLSPAIQFYLKMPL